LEILEDLKNYYHEVNIYIKKNLLDKNNKLNSNYIKKNQENINFFLSKHWSETISELYFCSKNNIEEQPKCYCGNVIKFNKTRFYTNYCSISCSGKSIHRIENIKKTNLIKYGVDFSFKSEEIKEKIKETNLERYGVENPSQNQNIKEKKKKTFLKNFGVENHTQKHIKHIENLNTEYINENFSNKEGLLKRTEILNYFNISENLLRPYRTRLKGLFSFKENKKQEEIYLFIKEKSNIKNNILLNTRQIIFNNNKLEIDILDIDNNIAIEYNGLMFHSFGINKYSMFNNSDKESSEKNKHLIKTELCEEQNIQLFHIFENEWLDNRQNLIWKSMINGKLGNHTRIFARKTIIKEIKLKDKYKNITNKNDNNLIRNFLEKNHMQGYVASGINIGLFIMNEIIDNDGLIKKNEELISLMTFGKSRISKEYEWELLRYATKLNTTVVGGGSKLLNYFENNYNPKSLISYANRRWSTGNFYKKTGFTFSHNSSPNYFYFKPEELNKLNRINKSKNENYNEIINNILYSRNQFQKHKLENYFKEGKLLSFDKKLSETQNMYNNGYRKIYDSGNMVFFKIY
jgi:hypothetical protein